jgi:hypothetical protein
MFTIKTIQGVFMSVGLPSGEATHMWGVSGSIGSIAGFVAGMVPYAYYGQENDNAVNAGLNHELEHVQQIVKDIQRSTRLSLRVGEIFQWIGPAVSTVGGFLTAEASTCNNSDAYKYFLATVGGVCLSAAGTALRAFGNRKVIQYLQSDECQHMTLKYHQGKAQIARELEEAEAQRAKPLQSEAQRAKPLRMLQQGLPRPPESPSDLKGSLKALHARHEAKFAKTKITESTKMPSTPSASVTTGLHTRNVTAKSRARPNRVNTTA